MPTDEHDDGQTRSISVLTAGTVVSHYKIISKIGAGGMGEVYLADDTELDRKVALKFLLPYLCQDEDGRKRFKREAQAAAALSHANIVTVHEVSEHDGRPYMAMEFLEGKTLRDLLSEKDLKLDRVTNLICQACDALAVAHDAGIVHRDIKPSNISVGSDDVVKILDFGLAISECFEQITRTGSTLGTVDYMSPEQVRGDEIDLRSDLFSVGVMLYELITGQKPFRRDNQIATLQAIVSDEPEPLARYKSSVPAELQRIVSKLLSKKPAERYQHADDVAVDLRALDTQLQSASSQSISSKPMETSQRRSPWYLILPCIVAAVAIAVIVWQFQQKSDIGPQHTMHLPVAIPDEYLLSERNVNKVAVSPQGDRWVLRVTDSLSVRQALLWETGKSNPRIIEGADGCSGLSFSPDGHWLCFYANDKLKKVHLAGGTPVDICDGGGFGSFWTSEDTVFYCPEVCSGIWKISVNGGEPKQVTSVGQNEFAHWSPEVLPNGRAVLFTIWNTGLADISTGILDLDSNSHRVLIPGGAHAKWVPTGHLVYIRRGTLMATPFDLEELRITGSEVPVAADLLQSHDVGLGDISFSRDGLMIYWASSADRRGRRVIWADQQGKITVQEHLESVDEFVSLSPDNKYLSYDKAQNGVFNIWILELATGRSRQVTFDGENYGATWHPVGDRVAFTTYRHGPYSVYEVPIDNSRPEYPLIVRDVDVIPLSYTPDGRRLLISVFNSVTDFDIEVMSLDDSAGVHDVYTLVESPRGQLDAVVHPAGEWVAYTSVKPGQSEIYIRHISGTGGITQVTVNGGLYPIWSRDGSRLFYMNKDRIMAVAVESEPQLRIGQPEEVLEIKNMNSYDVASDGRFVIVQRTGSDQPQVIAVTNWFDELKRLMASDR